MKKRVIAATLAAILCITAAGCGKDEKATSGDGGKLSYWVAMPALLSGTGVTFNELPMYEEYNKRTGIEVEFTHPPIGQEGEKFNLMIASGDLTDIVEYDWTKYSGGITRAVKDGIVKPMDDFVEKSAPNLYKILEENPDYKRVATTSDGKYYGFPRIKLGALTATSSGFFLRGDWLKKVGMEIPTSVSEWGNVLRAFKNELGIEKPLAFMASQLKGDTGNFNSEFEVGLEYYLKDDKVAYGPMEPGYKEMIKTLAGWYDEGLIDREFAVLTKDAVISQVKSGETGAFVGAIGGWVGGILNAVKPSNPEFSLVGAPFPKKDQSTTESYIGRVFPVVAPYACITKTCEEPEKAATWVDYCYGLEGSTLYRYGIEGETYNMEDGYPIRSELISNNPDGLSSFEAQARYHRGYSSEIGVDFLYGTPQQRAEKSIESLKVSYPYDEQIDAYFAFNKNSENRMKTLLPTLEYDSDIADEVANIKFEIDTYKDENVVRFISGDRPMEEWEEFTEELKSLKIDNLLSYMQDAYNQYLNK